MRSILCGIVLLFGTTLVFGQSETGRAALEGLISDATGRVIPAAKITAHETGTGLVRQAETNAAGEFRIGALPVGEYRVEISAPGFATGVIDNLSLSVGDTKTLNITLQVASINTQVTVETGADIINRGDASNSVRINERAIEDLPIRGRNFTEFAQLSPNVTQESNRFGIVVNGQRSINANISIDGVDFNDPLQNGPRGGGPKESAFFFPQLAVREFQMVLNGASAEVGRTNSGYLNVVTKTGTNAYHGAGFYENRNGAMTSPDAFGNDSSSNSQHQFGGSFGGPIRKDKLFFFGAVEKNMVDIPYTVKFDPPTGNVTVPPDIKAQEGEHTQKNNPLVAFGRLDYQLSPKNSINFQYTYAGQTGLDFGGVSGQTNAAATNNDILDRLSQGVKGGVTTVISPTLINEFRGQWVYDNRMQSPVSPLAETDIADFGVLNGSSNGVYIYDATRYEFLDNVSWIHGIHSIKFGVDTNYTPERQQREKNYGGLYNFNTLSDYLAALAGDKTKINRYQQSIAANGKQGIYEESQQEYAVFFTDTMRLRKDLTLTAGLRWEGQINPQPPPNPQYPINSQIPNDLKMWQPRLGLVYDIGGRGKTVIRLSGGIFDARSPGYLMQRVFTDNGFNTVILDSSVDPKVINFLTVPQPLTSVPPGLNLASNAIYAFDPTFRNPRSAQAAAAVEQQLDRNTTVTVGFVRNSTWSLQRRVDVNLFAPAVLSDGFVAYPTFDSKGNLVQASGYNAATGQGIYIDSTGKTLKPAVARPDPTIGQLNVNKSVGHSSYNGGYITVQRRFSHRLQFGGNYTYSVNRDDDSNERDFNRQYMLNVYNLKADAAYAKNDMRHSGNVNALYDIGKGFAISTLLLAHTGTPGRYVLGTDLNNDGNKDNDRPIVNGQLVPRDSTRYENFFDWDVRLIKTFRLTERQRLDISIEGYNLTRATNRTFNSDGDSIFGKPCAPGTSSPCSTTNPSATVNPNTGFAYISNTAGIATFSPGTDRFGGPRQAQLGIRYTF
jgi:hypothetical protein